MHLSARGNEVHFARYVRGDVCVLNDVQITNIQLQCHISVVAIEGTHEILLCCCIMTYSPKLYIDTYL